MTESSLIDSRVSVDVGSLREAPRMPWTKMRDSLPMFETASACLVSEQMMFRSMMEEVHCSPSPL